MTDSSLLLLILGAVFVLTGIAGLLLPALPGIALVFAGLVLAAWAENFVHIGQGTILVLLVLCLLGYGIDFLAAALGASRYGAGRNAVIGAAAGAVVGMFLGLPGIILGPFIGAVAGELLARKGLRQAGLAGFGAWVGMVMGIAGKFAVAMVMIGIFIFKRFF